MKSLIPKQRKELAGNEAFEIRDTNHKIVVSAVISTGIGSSNLEVNLMNDRRSGRRQIRKLALSGIFFCMFLFLASVSVQAEKKYDVEEKELVGTITADSSLNVRSGPGKEYGVIGKVKNNIVLHITGQTEDGWYQIELDGQTGYVSGQYVSAEEAGDGEESERENKEKDKDKTEVIGEPEEGYRGWNQSPQKKKIILIAAVILVLLVMIAATVLSMRREEDYDDDEEYDEDEDYDGDEEYDEDEDYDDDEEYGEYGYEDKYDHKKTGGMKKSAGEKRSEEYIIREEDYRIHIDPSFFEEKEYIEQPEMVTGYLEKLALEEKEKKQRELDLAMQKLNELQKEIERMKKET